MSTDDTDPTPPPPSRESATAADREARELAGKLVCALIDGPDGFNDPSSTKHPDLRGYRRSWIRFFMPIIQAHASAACARAVGEAVAGKDKRIAFEFAAALYNKARKGEL